MPREKKLEDKPIILKKRHSWKKLFPFIFQVEIGIPLQQRGKWLHWEDAPFPGLQCSIFCVRFNLKIVKKLVWAGNFEKKERETEVRSGKMTPRWNVPVFEEALVRPKAETETEDDVGVVGKRFGVDDIDNVGQRRRQRRHRSGDQRGPSCSASGKTSSYGECNNNFEAKES